MLGKHFKMLLTEHHRNPAIFFFNNVIIQKFQIYQENLANPKYIVYSEKTYGLCKTMKCLLLLKKNRVITSRTTAHFNHK